MVFCQKAHVVLSMYQKNNAVILCYFGRNLSSGDSFPLGGNSCPQVSKMKHQLISCTSKKVKLLSRRWIFFSKKSKNQCCRKKLWSLWCVYAINIWSKHIFLERMLIFGVPLDSKFSPVFNLQKEEELLCCPTNVTHTTETLLAHNYKWDRRIC